ncbi:MAG: hypothetical protein ACOZNI_02300 [Myxococcota bacterium]
MIPLDLHTTHLVGGRLFPEGLIYAFEAEARAPLWDSEHVLLKDAYVGLAGHAEITPAFPRGGPTLTIAPVAFWDLRLRAWGTWYFGSFTTLIAVDDPEYAATRENNRAEIDEGNRGWATATRLDADTRLKGRAGPVIAVLQLQVRKLDVAASKRDVDWYFEPSELLVVPAHGVTLHREGYLLVEAIRPAEAGDRMLRAGLYGTWSTCAATDDESVRAGPIAAWKPGERAGVPTLYAAAQAWLVSRFEDRWTPYTLLAAEWSR